MGEAVGEAVGGAAEGVRKHRAYHRMMRKAAKPSLTMFEVLSYETMEGLPVTRVELTPVTGRTHQLRVHCAAIGHPIVGDDIYGVGGEGSPNAGLPESTMSATFPARATVELQLEIDRVVKGRRRSGLGMGPGLGGDEAEAEAEAGGESPGAEGMGTGGAGNLCLHARFLSIFHPATNAPLIFEVDAPF